MDRAGALEAHETLAASLASHHRQLGMVSQQAKEARVRGYFDPSSAADSVSARDRFADGRALLLDQEVIHLRAEIAALEVELAHARLVVEYAVR